MNGIKCPTLIIWGEDDNIIPLEYGIKLHESIKNSRLEIIKSGGHVPHYTEWRETCGILSSFLANI